MGDEPVEFLNCMLLRVKLLTLSKISASTQIGSLQAVFFQKNLWRISPQKMKKKQEIIVICKDFFTIFQSKNNYISHIYT